MAWSGGYERVFPRFSPEKNADLKIWSEYGARIPIATNDQQPGQLFAPYKDCP